MDDRKQLIDDVVQDLKRAYDAAHSLNPAPANLFETMAIAMVEKFEPAPDLPMFMAGNEVANVENIDTAEYISDTNQTTVPELEKANVISSKMKGFNKHKPIIDLDFPAVLIPSSTPGHSHLYLDKELSHEEMEEFLKVLNDVGIIADGNMNQWWRYKAVFLRLPWVKKKGDSPKGRTPGGNTHRAG